MKKNVSMKHFMTDLTILAEVIEKEKEKGETVYSRVDAFRLYDTYGFPIELTEEYAEEAGYDS